MSEKIKITKRSNYLFDYIPIIEEKSTFIYSIFLIIGISFAEYYLLKLIPFNTITSFTLSFVTAYLLSGYLIYEVKLYTDKLLIKYPTRFLKRREIYFPINIEYVAYNVGGAKDPQRLEVNFVYDGKRIKKEIVISGFKVMKKKEKYFQVLDEYGIKTIG